MNLSKFLLLAHVFFFCVVNGERIVRFISSDGHEYYGDAILPSNSTDAALSREVCRSFKSKPLSEVKQAKIITGDPLGNFTVTNETKVSQPADNVESCC